MNMWVRTQAQRGEITYPSLSDYKAGVYSSAPDFPPTTVRAQHPGPLRSLQPSYSQVLPGGPDTEPQPDMLGLTERKNGSFCL